MNKSSVIYILFSNDVYINDNNFKKIDYLSSTKVKKAEYPTINEDIDKKKYNKIWIDYSDNLDLKIAKHGKLSAYSKYKRSICVWKPWMEICELNNADKKNYIGIHELEIINYCDDDTLKQKIDFWINEYKKIYLGNVINGNEKPKPKSLEESKIDVVEEPKKFIIMVTRSTQTSPQREPRTTCAKFTKQEIQQRYREKHRYKLMEKAREIYNKKKMEK